MEKEEHDKECEMYSEGCGCESRTKLHKAIKAAVEAEREACVKACEAAEDTGNSRGIERDVAMWNKAVAYCVRRLKERPNV